MQRTPFAMYRRPVARNSSSVSALLAAIVLDAVVVISLLHIALRAQPGSGSQKARTIEPGRRVTFITLSPADQTSATTDVVTKAAAGLSTKSTLSQSTKPTILEPQTAPTDTVVRSSESSRQRSRQTFQALVPQIVERTTAEVIDSIIATSIQPGNDSAARMRLARRNAVDWTVHIGGGSFGMSPGRVHLGKISIRMPLVFAEPLSFDSDRRRMARGSNDDTRSNAARAARDAAFDSAVASIRLRKEAQLAARPNR
jgi:hypothetical protein